MQRQFFYYGPLEIYTIAEKYMNSFKNPWIAVTLQQWQTAEVYIWLDECQQLRISELSTRRASILQVRNLPMKKVHSIGTIASFFTKCQPSSIIENPFLAFYQNRQPDIEVEINPIIKPSKGICTFDEFITEKIRPHDTGSARMKHLEEYNPGLYAQLVVRECRANLTHASNVPDLDQSKDFYCWLKKNWV